MRIASRIAVAAALIAAPCCVVRAIMPQGADFVRTLPPGVNLYSGDVVLLGSATWRGRLLKIFDRDSFYAHTGIIDKEEGVDYLVHADPCRNAVVRESLDAYLASNDVERVRVMRVENSKDNAIKASSFAHEQWSKSCRFNRTFRYGEGDGLYCTELVLCAWRSAGMSLLCDIKKGDRVFPSELLKSSLLKPVVECFGADRATGRGAVNVNGANSGNSSRLRLCAGRATVHNAHVKRMEETLNTARRVAGRR